MPPTGGIYTFPIPIKKAINMIIPDKPRRGYRTIRLPVNESDYSQFESDTSFAKTKIDQLYHEHPELFPTTFASGYVFNGKTSYPVKSV
jgi:hypothetical protein